LRLNLISRSDQERLAAGIVGMAGQDKALRVKHLQYRKLGEIGKLSVLHWKIGKQNRIGSRLAYGTFDLLPKNQSSLDQMLDRIRRAPTQNAQADLRYLDPLDSLCNIYLPDSHACGHNSEIKINIPDEFDPGNFLDSCCHAHITGQAQ
jgi:hypothetical protein